MNDPARPPGPGPSAPGPATRDDQDDTPDVEVSASEVELDAALDGLEPPPRAGDEDLEAALDRALARSESPPADPEPIEAAVVVLRGRDTGRVYGFRGGAVLIGRAPSAQIRLDEPSVSQRHALIERVGTRFFVTDLGSSNGTSVNGIPISGATPLRNGDRVEVVNVVLLFRLGSGAPHHDTAPLERWPHELALAPLPIGPAPLSPYGGGATLALAQDEERAPTLEEQVQKVLVALAYVRRHWRILVSAPAIAGVLGILSVGLSPPPNRAECTVSLDTTPPENPLERERVVRRGAEPEFFRDASTTFAEGRLVRATLAELGEPDPNEYRVKDVSEALSFTQTSETLFVASMTDRDGDWALRFLRAHLELYLSREIEKTLRVYQAEVDLLNTRVQEIDARLERGESELRRFREKNLEHLPEFATNRVAAAAGMESRAGELGANVARLRGELALARQRLERESPLIEAKVREASPYQEALTAANRRLAELRARGLGADHPEIRQALAETENLQRQVEETTRAAPTDLDRTSNPEYTRLKDQVAELEVALSSAQQEQAAVGGQLGWADEALRKLPGVEAELGRITRGLETDRALHGRLVERLRQAETQLEIGRATARARYDIVAPPHTVGVAIRRTLAMRAAMGMAAGLLLAIVWVAWVELMAIVRRLPRVDLVEQRAPGESRAVRRR